MYAYTRVYIYGARSRLLGRGNASERARAHKIDFVGRGPERRPPYYFLPPPLSLIHTRLCCHRRFHTAAAIYERLFTSSHSSLSLSARARLFWMRAAHPVLSPSLSRILGQVKPSHAAGNARPSRLRGPKIVVAGVREQAIWYNAC